MAKAEPVANAGGNSNDIFQRSAQFHAHYVVIGVNAEAGFAEFALHQGGEFAIVRADADGGRIAARHLAGKRGPAEGADARLLDRAGRPQHLADDLRHPHQRVVFDPLAGADEQHVACDVRRHLLEDGPAMVRGHDAEHDFGSA
jgi:hypothetical protein